MEHLAADVTEVRAALVRAGWTVDGVLDLLGADGWGALGRDETVPAARALRADPAAAASPCGVLTRLFLLGQAVPGRELRMLPGQAMRALGLVDERGDDVVASLDLRPYGEVDSDWYVVSDLDTGSRGQDMRADHVLGVGGASLTLAGLVPRPFVARALDLGTGCGVQALHLSRHVGHVVATDTNPRALELAALGWALSGLEPARVQWRQGSLLEPVVGERFDLVVSNPPFVVSPAHRYTYRDAGLRGDELGRRLLQQSPAHLAQDGWCVLMANWLHQRGRDWRERVAAWAEPALASGCDVWVAQREALDVGRYAENWLQDAGDHRSPEHAARYDEWLASFAGDDVEAVGMGWVVLHRRGGEGWLAVEDVAGAVRLPTGDEVAARMVAGTARHGLGAVAALAARPRLPAGAVLERATRTRADGSTMTLPARLRLASDEGGWREPLLLDSVGAALVERCDGTMAVSEAIDAAASVTGSDPDDVRALALHLVRDLVDRGLLLTG